MGGGRGRGVSVLKNASRCGGWWGWGIGEGEGGEMVHYLEKKNKYNNNSSYSPQLSHLIPIYNHNHEFRTALGPVAVANSLSSFSSGNLPPNGSCVYPRGSRFVSGGRAKGEGGLGLV